MYKICLIQKDNDNQGGIEEQEESESVGPVLPEGHRFDRKFICIKYPGNVINPDKAIKTLGGINAISTVYILFEMRFQSLCDSSLIILFLLGGRYSQQTFRIAIQT